MKVLTEINEFDLALKLADQFNLGIGYPVAAFFKLLLSNDQAFDAKPWLEGQAPSLIVEEVYGCSPSASEFDVVIQPLYRLRVKGLG